MSLSTTGYILYLLLCSRTKTDSYSNNDGVICISNNTGTQSVVYVYTNWFGGTRLKKSCYSSSLDRHSLRGYKIKSC